MPSTSVAQQHFMALVLAKKRGELKHSSPKVDATAKSMSSVSVKHFAATPHKGLPEHVKKEASVGLLTGALIGGACGLGGGLCAMHRHKKKEEAAQDAAADKGKKPMSKNAELGKRAAFTVGGQDAAERGKRKWFGPIAPPSDTPLPDMMSSPAKGALLYGGAGAALGAGWGGGMGAVMGSPGAGALMGSATGGVLGAGAGALGRWLNNRSLEDVMRHHGDDATRRDYLTDPARRGNLGVTSATKSEKEKSVEKKSEINDPLAYLAGVWEYVTSKNLSAEEAQGVIKAAADLAGAFAQGQQELSGLPGQNTQTQTPQPGKPGQGMSQPKPAHAMDFRNDPNVHMMMQRQEELKNQQMTGAGPTKM